MQSGKLRKRIAVLDKQVSRAANGEEKIAWFVFLRAWASIEPLRGREYLEARQVQADVDTRMRLRHQPGKDILPRMRVSHNGRTFEIESVINVREIGAEINLMCSELIDEVIEDANGESV
jgi:SPP1 family predicted phage head-tail adaptor